MRIIPLVAAYREPRHLLEGLMIQLAQHFPQSVVVLDDFAYSFPTGTIIRRGNWHRERPKRNALLELARMELEPTDQDWLLSIDPDERLVGVAGLSALLEQVPQDQPAYPLLRQERDGRVWALPCKLFRGSAIAYAYLDTHVVFSPPGEPGPSRTWNLDPYQIADRGIVLPGWPSLIHLGGRRVVGLAEAQQRAGFYTEPDPPPRAINYQELRAVHDDFHHAEGVIRR